MTIELEQKNGRLVFIADDEAREELLALLDDPAKGYPAALGYVCEEIAPRGWSLVPPEDVGALTDSPIFSDSYYPGDNESGPSVAGPVHWFPDYMIRDEWRELATLGRVEFHSVD